MLKRFDLQRPNLLCNTCEGVVFSRGQPRPIPGAGSQHVQKLWDPLRMPEWLDLFPVANVVNYPLVDWAFRKS